MDGGGGNGWESVDPDGATRQGKASNTRVRQGARRGGLGKRVRAQSDGLTRAVGGVFALQLLGRTTYDG